MIPRSQTNKKIKPLSLLDVINSTMRRNTGRFSS
uniref:Uncharacterized protein n=1 Tax=Arundo donax TaxID=35708 RepID=A0A0A9HB23_ARUDO